VCHTVSIVLGVPTIKRERESYLSHTVQSLIDSLDEDEKSDCLIVVMICEVCF
jgi:alpha-1,3-mannosylglycoprotein beta-1,4-N-acetylglucosaminyltransferase A/B